MWGEEMTLREQVGKQLRAARGDVKVKDIAARIGSSPQYVSGLESGKINSTLDRIEQYAESLGKKIEVVIKKLL